MRGPTCVLFVGLGLSLGLCGHTAPPPPGQTPPLRRHFSLHASEPGVAARELLEPAARGPSGVWSRDFSTAVLAVLGRSRPRS